MTDSTKPTVKTQPQHRDEVKETLRTIIYAMIIAAVIRTLAFEPFNIPSGSMEPTLHIGDFLFVSKYSYGYSSRGTFMGLLPIQGRIGGDAPQRGDIIVFKLPEDNSTDYIKRLVGLPGDTIEMRHGMLYVNGVPAQRERLDKVIRDKGLKVADSAVDYMETLPGGVHHIIRKHGDENQLDNTSVFVVPERHYFFMGDNRDNSQDSRAKHVGFVPEENLVGRAEILFFSIDDKTRFWEIWKWPSDVRWDRLFKRITPNAE